MTLSIGQAMHYRYSLRRQGALDLIEEVGEFREQAEAIEAVPADTEIQLIIL